MKKFLLSIVATLALAITFISCSGKKSFDFYFYNNTTGTIRDWSLLEWNSFCTNDSNNYIFYHNDDNNNYRVESGTISETPITVPENEQVIPLFLFNGDNNIYTSWIEGTTYNVVTMDCDIIYYAWQNKYYTYERSIKNDNKLFNIDESKLTVVGEVAEDGTWIIY